MCLLGMSFLPALNPSYRYVWFFHSWFIPYRVSPWCFNTPQGFCHLLFISIWWWSFYSLFVHQLIPPVQGLCCRLLWAAPGIACCHRLAGLRFGGFLRFSTLSSLRQAKINWAEPEVAAVSRFPRFTCEIGIAWGISSHFFSGVN